MTSLLLMFFMAHSAPHTSFPDNVSKATLRQMVATADRPEEIKKLGPEGYKQLRTIMLSSDEKVEHRWNATLVLAQIGGPDSLPDIEKALKDSTWYMRSAGLLATSLVDKQRGYKIAKDLMSKDPALLVRASALQVLAQDGKLDRSFLWKELYNPRNFSNGHGLSIRQSILKVLAKNAEKSESAKFAALVKETDKAVRVLAQQSLTTLNK